MAIKLHKKETVDEAGDRGIYRYRVDGGWLYLAREWGATDENAPVAIALQFVPDSKETRKAQK